MAHREARTSPPHRTYALRTATQHQHQHIIHSAAPRPALAQLQTNLRRLPSRLNLTKPMPVRDLRDRDDREHDVQVPVGSKRKRNPSGNENYHHPRTIRAAGGRFKRHRPNSSDSEHSEDNSSEQLEMDVDDSSAVSRNTSNSDDDDDSSDDFMIRYAPLSRLNRLRRNELVRLAELAGLTDHADAATKVQIAESIVTARDIDELDFDDESLPPTPGDQDPPTSPPSSDEGHDGGGEETDVVRRRTAARMPLGRRQTESSLNERGFRPLKGRSLSMGLIGKSATKARPRFGVGKAPNGLPTRRYVSQQNIAHWQATSSANSVLSSIAPPSPPVTRARQRKTSGKHVGFKDDINSIGSIGSTDADDHSSDALFAKAPTGRRSLFPNLAPAQPSPRRLRSKSRSEISSQSSGSQAGQLLHDESDLTEVDDDRHVIDVDAVHEEEEEEEEEEQSEEDEDEPQRSKSSPIRKRGRYVSRQLPTSTESSQPDEPLSSASSPGKRRLRPRRPQAYTPPSDGDGDDEGGDDEEEAVVETEAPNEEDAEEEAEEDMSISVDDGQSDEDETPLAKVLRNGKTVGDIALEEEESDEADRMDESDATVSGEEAAEEDEITEDADMLDEDDDIDLEGATARTLARLKRDELLRMCASRDIEVEGTKPQLVDALLQWRERQSSVHCPSSGSTARPPSTARTAPRQRRHGRNKSNTPLLLREHIHTDEPRTPPVSDSERAKTIGGGKDEGELDLDLGGLGLEDHEISPKDLVKLEKIGSGGFKDVFIGKLKNRKKVAISEFRGQLSAMDIKELKLLSEFNHPNVVKFLGVCVPDASKDTPVAIVSELCTNGDLFDYVRNVPPPSLLKVVGIALDIAHGIEYLHNRKPSVIHRDCKSSNILITNKGNAKIADFGLAKVKQSTRSMVVSLVGTVNWQAPELWHAHPKYNHKVDVFSCAMVYWEMLQWYQPQKRYPWEGMNEHAIYDAVGAKRQRPSMVGMKKQWCPDLVDLIERMWSQDPGDRPTMTEVVRELERIQTAYK